MTGAGSRTVMRRVVVATLLASAALVPAVNASASASFHAIGIVSSVDAQRHVVTLRDSGGDKSLQGRTIRIHATPATHVKRDGKATNLAALRPGDGVDAAGRSAAALVATRIDATSP